jgi:hypothetical protein
MLIDRRVSRTLFALVAALLLFAAASCKNEAENFPVDPDLARALILHIDSASTAMRQKLSPSTPTPKEIYLRLPLQARPTPAFIKRLGSFPFTITGFNEAEEIKSGQYATIISINGVIGHGANSVEVVVTVNPQLQVIPRGHAFRMDKEDGEWRVTKFTIAPREN